MLAGRVDPVSGYGRLSTDGQTGDKKLADRGQTTVAPDVSLLSRRVARSDRPTIGGNCQRCINDKMPAPVRVRPPRPSSLGRALIAELTVYLRVLLLHGWNEITLFSA